MDLPSREVDLEQLEISMPWEMAYISDEDDVTWFSTQTKEHNAQASDTASQRILTVSDNGAESSWARFIENTAEQRDPARLQEGSHDEIRQATPSVAVPEEDVDTSSLSTISTPDTPRWLPARGKSVSVSELEREAIRHQRLVQEALARGESPFSLSPIPSESPPPTESPVAADSSPFIDLPLSRERSEPSQNRKKRKRTKSKIKDEVVRPAKRSRPNPPSSFQRPLSFAPPQRRAAAKVNVLLSATYPDDEDENEREDDGPASDVEDESWAPNKKEKKKAEQNRIRVRDGVARTRSRKPTFTRAAPIPNTSVFKLERIQSHAIKKKSKAKKRKLSIARPQSLETVCKSMTRKLGSLREREVEMRNLVCVLRQPNLELARIDDIDPLEVDASNAPDSDDDDIEEFFEIRAEFGHRGPASWIPSLAKIRDNIPKHILPTPYLFWDFCLHEGVFDGSLETRTKYEKERVRRWRVLRELKNQGIIDNLHIFNVTIFRKTSADL